MKHYAVTTTCTLLVIVAFVLGFMAHSQVDRFDVVSAYKKISSEHFATILDVRVGATSSHEDRAR